MKTNNFTTSKDLDQDTSPNCSKYSSDESSYATVVKKNLFKNSKMQMSFRDTYKKEKIEDNQLTTSSITLNSNISETSPGDKAITIVIKQNKRHKNKSKNLKKYIKTLQEKLYIETHHKINKQIDLEWAFLANTITGSNELNTGNYNGNKPVQEPTCDQNMLVQISFKKSISEGNDVFDASGSHTITFLEAIVPQNVREPT